MHDLKTSLSCYKVLERDGAYIRSWEGMEYQRKNCQFLCATCDLETKKPSVKHVSNFQDVGKHHLDIPW